VWTRSTASAAPKPADWPTSAFTKLLISDAAGWRLNVSAELARLVKTARVAVDGTSPARDERSKAPFSRRRYVLAALAMAVLERADAQLTLGRLAEQVLVAAADPALAEAGVTFTMESRDERGDLVAVVRLLLRLGVLRKGGRRGGRLAARVLGSPHALDDGRPVTSLVFGAARVLSGLADGKGASWRRDVWSAVGVLPDDLSSSVLLLGFPGDRKLPLGRVLGEWKSVGEPVSLTLRQLRAPGSVELAGALGIGPGQEVYVCENPVVVSTAADSLGSRCAPLVCISGQPGVAAQVLLRRLASTGAKLRYHGDFDWGGVRIANGVIGNFGAAPWRMDVSSYLAAVALGSGRTLEGAAVQASWDPELAPAMSEHVVGVDEEHVLDDLMNDL
jgi:uncharacterized protein (TIGR02679 family)